MGARTGVSVGGGVNYRMGVKLNKTCPHPALRATFPQRGKAKPESVIFRKLCGVAPKVAPRNGGRCHEVTEGGYHMDKGKGLNGGRCHEVTEGGRFQSMKGRDVWQRR